MFRKILSAIILTFGILCASGPAAKHRTPPYYKIANYVEKVRYGTGLSSFKEPYWALTYADKHTKDGFSLGDRGYIILGYTDKENDKSTLRCFRNVKGWDLKVQEVIQDNVVETVKVSVTGERTIHENTKWHSLGKGKVGDREDTENFIYFDLDRAGLKRAYFVKVEDAGDEKNQNGVDNGFDLTAVVFNKMCRPTA